MFLVEQNDNIFLDYTKDTDMWVVKVENPDDCLNV